MEAERVGFTEYDVNESTICRLRRTRIKSLNSMNLAELVFRSKRKRTTDLELVDTALLEWFQVNAAQPGLVGTILLEKLYSVYQNARV